MLLAVGSSTCYCSKDRDFGNTNALKISLWSTLFKHILFHPPKDKHITSWFIKLILLDWGQGLSCDIQGWRASAMCQLCGARRISFYTVTTFDIFRPILKVNPSTDGGN